MPYAPGTQNISGQLLAQGIRDAGQNIGDGIRQYQQNKVMAGQAIGKFEGAARANPEILQFLQDPASPPDVSKAYKKLQKEGSVGVRDAAILAQFADTYNQEKNQQAAMIARAKQAEAQFLRAQQAAASAAPTMALDALQKQFPHDKYDANMVPVAGQPGMVQVKSVNPRSPVSDKPQMVPTPDGVNVYGPKGDLIRTDKVGMSPADVERIKLDTERVALAKKDSDRQGEKVTKEDEAKKKASEARLRNETERLATIRDTLKDAISMTGPTTTGIIGSVNRRIPGSKGTDLEKKLDTIKANIGFKELRQMREESPTGGALGQIAVKELDYLQSVEGSLDQVQSEAQLRATLQTVDASLARLQQALGSGATSQADSILSKYGIK